MSQKEGSLYDIHPAFEKMSKNVKRQALSASNMIR